MPRPMHSPSPQTIEVEDFAVSQLRAQVASLQAERQAVCESDASRQKKATYVSPDLVPLVGDVPVLGAAVGSEGSEKSRATSWIASD